MSQPVHAALSFLDLRQRTAAGRKTFLPRLKESLGSQPPFLRDTELLVEFRTYYLLRDNLNGSENEAWAAGRWLCIARLGWLLDLCDGSRLPTLT